MFPGLLPDLAHRGRREFHPNASARGPEAEVLLAWSDASGDRANVSPEAARANFLWKVLAKRQRRSSGQC